MAAPKQIYLLRKSRQSDDKVPVLRRADFPLLFQAAGKEVTIEVSSRGQFKLTTTRLIKANNDQP